MTKKIISIVLCVVMLMSVAPMAFATETITYVDCYLPRLYAGDHPCYAPAVRENEGYEIGNPYGDVDGAINGVRWTDETAGERLNASSVLVEGHTYSVSISVKAKRGYQFPETYSPSGYINDCEDSVSVSTYGDYIVLSETYDCAPNKTDIESAKLEVSAPVVGEHPDYAVDVLEGNVYIDATQNDNSYVNGVAWMDASSHSFISADSVFEAGKSYRVIVFICASDGYKFAFGDLLQPDMPTVNIVCSANVDGETKNYDGFVSGGDDTYAHIGCEMPAVALQAKTKIEKVELTGTAPVAGNKPNYTVSVPSNAPYVIDTSVNDGGFINGVRWWNNNSLASLGKNDTFEEGVPYSIHVKLKAKDGYDFVCDEYSELDAEVAFNGDSNGSGGGNEGHHTTMMVSYYFGSGSQGDYLIKSVDLQGQVIKVGDRPNYNINLPEGVDYKIANMNHNDYINGVAWFNATTLEYMKPTDTFKAGFEYRLLVNLEAINGSEFDFADDNDLTSLQTTITYNGNPADYANAYFDNLLVSVDFLLAGKISDCATKGFSSGLSYTGKAVKQTKFKLLNNGNELTEGEDYTVKYANNVKIGTASMTITGIGKYTGSATLKFKILPAKPVVSVSKVTDSTVTLKWRAVTGAKYYSVYEYNAKTKKYTGVFLKTTGTTYTAKKKAAGTKYFYIVRAFDSTYNYGSAFTTADLVSAITLCKAPTITGIAGSKGRLAIKWSSCTGAYYYNVYRYNRATKKYTLVKKTTATAFSMAAKKGTYYFLVRAYNANSVGSAFTTKNIVRVTVK